MNKIHLGHKLALVAGLLGGLLTLNTTAHAEWMLNKQNANFTFVTTKAVNKSEVQKFTRLDGGVSSGGKVDVQIDLSSVDTNNPIRDERMLSMLFQVTKYSKTARFTGQLPAAMMQQLKAGAVVTRGVIEGQIEMHGKTVTQKVMVDVFPENGSLWVASASPILVSAKAFGMSGGIEALRKIMGLSSINEQVAANFILQFNPK